MRDWEAMQRAFRNSTGSDIAKEKQQWETI